MSAVLLHKDFESKVAVCSKQTIIKPLDLNWNLGRHMLLVGSALLLCSDSLYCTVCTIKDKGSPGVYCIGLKKNSLDLFPAWTI